MHVYIYIHYIYAYVCACMYACMHGCSVLHLFICLYEQVCVFMSVRPSVCLCTHARIRTCICLSIFLSVSLSLLHLYTVCVCVSARNTSAQVRLFWYLGACVGGCVDVSPVCVCVCMCVYFFCVGLTRICQVPACFCVFRRRRMSMGIRYTCTHDCTRMCAHCEGLCRQGSQCPKPARG